MDMKKGAEFYRRLLVMAVLSFAAMYVLMYAMVNTFANVYGNLNQFYMAALMTSPMMLIELTVMRSMYQKKRWNVLLRVASASAIVIAFLFIRQQTAITDKQFLRSMIPHHAGAILMCERASLHDPEIKELCRTIMTGQQNEIARMKAKLDALSR